MTTTCGVGGYLTVDRSLLFTPTRGNTQCGWLPAREAAGCGGTSAGLETWLDYSGALESVGTRFEFVIEEVCIHRYKTILYVVTCIC